LPGVCSAGSIFIEQLVRKNVSNGKVTSLLCEQFYNSSAILPLR
jgi:hypothetical protein